jgi:hypothetical protein
VHTLMFIFLAGDENSLIFSIVVYYKTRLPLSQEPHFSLCINRGTENASELPVQNPLSLSGVTISQ